MNYTVIFNKCRNYVHILNSQRSPIIYFKQYAPFTRNFLLVAIYAGFTCRIQYPVKHLKWSFWRKQLKANKSYFVLAVNTILDAYRGSEYVSGLHIKIIIKNKTYAFSGKLFCNIRIIELLADILFLEKTFT